MATHGGARAGAGRKTNEYRRRVAALLARTLQPADLDDIINALIIRAYRGDVSAIKLLLEFCFNDLPDDAAMFSPATRSAQSQTSPPQSGAG